METAFNLSLVILTVLYSVLTTGYARIFARGADGVARFVRPLLVSAIALNFLSILLRGVLVGQCPLGSRPEFMSLVAFSIGLVYLILELRIGERATGVFVITPVFLLHLITAVQLLGMESLPEKTLGVADAVHAVAAIVGFSAVTISSVYGILYLFLYAAIKRGRFGLFYRKMPSLETLSELNLLATLLAFLALTATVGLGWWGYLRSHAGAVTLAQPEVILTCSLWVLYGGCLFARRFLGLGGKRVAYTTVLGFFLLIGVFLGGFFKRGFHG